MPLWGRAIDIDAITCSFVFPFPREEHDNCADRPSITKRGRNEREGVTPDNTKLTRRACKPLASPQAFLHSVGCTFATLALSSAGKSQDWLTASGNNASGPRARWAQDPASCPATGARGLSARGAAERGWDNLAGRTINGARLATIQGPPTGGTWSGARAGAHCCSPGVVIRMWLCYGRLHLFLARSKQEASKGQNIEIEWMAFLCKVRPGCTQSHPSDSMFG